MHSSPPPTCRERGSNAACSTPGRCSAAHNLIQASPTLRDDELRLGDYGLEYIKPDPVVHIPFPDGTWLTQWRDLDRTCEEFARFSRRDADAYRRLIADYDAAKSAFGGYRYTPI